MLHDLLAADWLLNYFWCCCRLLTNEMNKRWYRCVMLRLLSSDSHRPMCTKNCSRLPLRPCTQIFLMSGFCCCCWLIVALFLYWYTGKYQDSIGSTIAAYCCHDKSVFPAFRQRPHTTPSWSMFFLFNLFKVRVITSTRFRRMDCCCLLCCVASASSRASTNCVRQLRPILVANNGPL